MEKNKYNLPKSEGVQIPIQLQLSEGNKFSMNLQELNSPGHVQQSSDQNSSETDLDCSGLMETLDSDDVSTRARLFDTHGSWSEHFYYENIYP